jgi:hypothetical protein
MRTWRQRAKLITVILTAEARETCRATADPDPVDPDFIAGIGKQCKRRLVERLSQRETPAKQDNLVGGRP